MMLVVVNVNLNLVVEKLRKHMNDIKRLNKYLT